MTRIPVIITLKCAFLLALFATPVTASSLSSSVSMNVSWWDPVLNKNVSEEVIKVTGGSQAVVDPGVTWSKDPQSPVGMGATNAYYGWMQAGAQVERAVQSVLTDPTNWYIFGVSAGSSFTDTITLSSPDYANGTQGEASFIFDVSGTASGDRSGANASAGLYIKNLTTGKVLFQNYYLPGGDHQYTSQKYTFTFGVPFTFTASFSALVSLSGLEAGSSSAWFMNTAQFSGMNVSLGTTPITNFTITAESGALYPISTIPEPVTMLLLGLGLIGLAGIRRKMHI